MVKLTIQGRAIWHVKGDSFSPVMFIGDTLSLGFETPEMNELRDLMIMILPLDLEKL